MVERLRLSDVSSQAIAALAALDAVELDRLHAQLQQALAGRLALAPERAEAVSAPQRVLQEVLAATAQNIQVLQRLQDREGKPEWAR